MVLVFKAGFIVVVIVILSEEQLLLFLLYIMAFLYMQNNGEARIRISAALLLTANSKWN